MLRVVCVCIYIYIYYTYINTLLVGFNKEVIRVRAQQWSSDPDSSCVPQGSRSITRSDAEEKTRGTGKWREQLDYKVCPLTRRRVLRNSLTLSRKFWYIRLLYYFWQECRNYIYNIYIYNLGRKPCSALSASPGPRSWCARIPYRTPRGRTRHVHGKEK